MLTKSEMADILDECGTLLELKGENAFRVNAYRNAARALTQLDGPIEDWLAEDQLQSIKGIGKTMAEKIAELAETGKLAFHQELKAEIPPGLVEMLKINGFGPKRICQVHEQLGVSTISELAAVCRDDRLSGLKGFGPKLARKVLEGIAFLEKTASQFLYPVAREAGQMLLESLEKLDEVERIELCGSLRRGKSTIKDIDLLVASQYSEPVMQRFIEHPEVDRVVNHGPTKSSVVLRSGIACDLRVVTPEQFPFALHYFTGSKEHNVAVRARAQTRGLKLNEYELADQGKSIPCKDEVELFRALDLDWIPPELREDTGEIEAAANGSLPRLVRDVDLRGAFHCHTTASDGQATLEEMADQARALGWEYLGIADHSQTASYAGGLTPARVREQQAAIDRLNAGYSGFRLFKGIESDILADGSLDYDEKVLASFDYVVASVHSHLQQDRDTMTRRVLTAVRHPRCTMLGHPTGQLLLRRDPFAIDLEAVLKAAAETGTLIEINANPMRLDIDWTWVKRAKALGVTLVINPDAHDVFGLADVRYGLNTARRGWLEAKDVFNTRSTSEVIEFLNRRRAS